jgi:hypothetical protein
MDILDELKLGPEPATDPATKARIEAALQAHVPHRQTRRGRKQPRIARIAAIAVAVLIVAGAALAETSPWHDEQEGWSSMTALVSHDPSTMVLGAVPQLLHCTSSLADCTTEDGGGAGERSVIFLFRAGEAPSTTVDHRTELGPVSEAAVAAAAFRIWTNGSAPRDPALDPVSCASTDTGWTCSQLDPNGEIPAGTPIYLPQSETVDPVYWAWGTPSTGSPR